MIMRGPASRRLSWVGLAGAIALGPLALPAWTLGKDKTPPPLTTAAPPAIVIDGRPPPAPVPATLPGGAYYQPVTTYRVVPESSFRLVKPGDATSPTPIQGVPATPAAAPPAGADDRDQKLKELDDKVQQLLKEMQQLREQVSPADKYEDLAQFHFTGGTGSATSIKDKGVFTVLTVAADKVMTKLSITFAFKEDAYRRADDFRVVAVDAAGKRYEGNVQSSAGAEGKGVEMVTVMSEFPLASDKIAALVIRQRTEKGKSAPPVAK